MPGPAFHVYAFNAAVDPKEIVDGTGVIRLHEAGTTVLFVKFFARNGKLVVFGQTFAGPTIPKIGFTWM
jgi:hypothetical protein